MRALDQGRGEVVCLVAPDVDDAVLAAVELQVRAPQVEVVRERRRHERRAAGRRRRDPVLAPARDRRRVRNRDGRRIDERRALEPCRDLPLPAALRGLRGRIAFFAQGAEDRQRIEAADSLRLVVRFQLGEPDAFRALYERHFDRVYAYLVAVLRDRQEAEDVAQDVFISTLRALPRFEIRGARFEAWLFRIARNRALDVKRQARSIPADPASIDLWRDQRDQQGGAAAGRNADDHLFALIERLPPSQRQVLVLRYMGGLDWHEIAAVVGRSNGAVRQLEQRALASLRRRVAEGEPAPTSRTRAMPMIRLPRASPVASRRRSALLTGFRAA